MSVFERGVRAMQQHQFKEATKLLSSIFQAHPDEKELHDRARVYLAICARQSASPRDQAPRTAEERMNAATVALNRGSFDQALELLRSLEREDGGNDLVHYMLAVAHAALGNAHAAIPHLRQAVEQNTENRSLALQDADLDPLRNHPDFAAILDKPEPRRRPAARARAGR
jgi:Tfp pilus assembly protein PilF